MDRATRKELKSDKFALEVQHGFEFVTGHRQSLVRWSIVGGAAVIVIVAALLFMQHRATVQQAALQNAMRTENAAVGPANNEYILSYPTQAAKDQAAVKAWTEIAAKYGGSEAGVIAEYYLASHAADRGNVQEAEKRFQEVVDSGKTNYSSLARLPLAQLYASDGKMDQAKKTLQEVIAHPTAMVSKDAATIALARLIAPSDPQGARKLLEPLRGSDRSAVSRAAITAISDLPK